MLTQQKKKDITAWFLKYIKDYIYKPEQEFCIKYNGQRLKINGKISWKSINGAKSAISYYLKWNIQYIFKVDVYSDESKDIVKFIVNNLITIEPI